jgi:hypothetical protein
MRACLNIRSLKQDGEVFDFTEYIYNDFNKTEDQFKQFVENNADQFALDACYDVGSEDELDFVTVTSIEYDAEEW